MRTGTEMPIRTPTLIDWLFLVMFVLLTLMFIFQAYVNFAKNRLSKFSYDALSLFLAVRLSSKSHKEIKSISENTKRSADLAYMLCWVLLAGFMKLLSGFLSTSLNNLSCDLPKEID